MTTLPLFNRAHVLIVGDVMLDRYWHGITRRISPEAPVAVVKVEECIDKPGGAANVAMNIASLGAHATLLSCVGNDDAADILESMLTAAAINTEFFRCKDLPTITKLRVLSQHQQLIRLDFEHTPEQLSPAVLFKPYEKLLAQANIVVLSDYGKGTLYDPQIFIQAARAANIPVLVDPKRLDFAAYRGATLVTPNRFEFEAVVGPCPDESTLVSKGLALLKEYALEGLLITRGEQGMTLVTKQSEPVHLPAYAREVYDVTGAGDTVIGVLAATLGTVNDLPLAMKLANAAAAVVVGKLGTATVSNTELSVALAQLQPAQQGIVDVEQLLALRANARQQGEKVVMTNGCFDLLHAGHIAYLAQAKALGDRLIVAVNDDNSVQRLKGDARPLNPVLQRMQVLAGLRAVDWVVPFSTDTPRDLIAAVLPDILVKGGDYQVEQIAGHQEVLANGGSVETLQFIPGCSTTHMIAKIKKEEKI